jgi:uncharacterized phage infection (PIP) family protein YhgE
LFQALGVSIKDAKGNLRSLEDVLPEIASGFKNIQNETLKAAVAQEVFGKSGTDLIEFLNQGADGLGAMRDRARDLGIELSQGTLSGADQFNDKVGDLKVVTQALFTQLANELLPTLTKLVDKLTEVADEGNKSGGIIKWIGDQAEAAANDFDFMSKSLDALGDVFGGLKDSAVGYYHALLAIKNLDLGEGKQAFAEMQAGSARSRDGLTRDVRNVGNATPAVTIPGMDFGFKFPGQKPSFSAVPVGGVGAVEPSREAAVNRALAGGDPKAGKAKKEGKSDAEKEIERLEAAYKSFSAQQLEQIALFGKEGEAAKVRYDVEQGSLKGLSEAKKQELIANAEVLDQKRADDELSKKRAKADADHAERFAGILDDMRTESDLLGKSIEQQEEYIKLKYLGAEANEVERQAVIEGNKAYHERERLIARQTELMDTFRNQASGALTDVITGTKSLSDAFKDMFDNIAERITQMIADKWIEQLFGQMGTSGGGSNGNWLGSLFGMMFGGGGFAKGGAFYSGQPVQAFANGGVFDRPTAFGMAGGRLGVMGEAGPEAIMPLTRGRDGKLGVRAEGNSSTFAPVLNQTFVVSGTPDNRTREQMARSSGREAARGISRTGR